ncbi:cation diffusion facilitator family transporter [Commensalibacter melissae]|uniref:cation diffusion facilitator family transporter n=1 Tax=Commensalibacter melissae TaxID=2070537 RepID=UPI0012D9F72C|nr:cation diffusion facilitator family transporter [Commensalibacter melissae]MUG80649.1 cation diffusion facilitator family transporter [Commensalibacter melissae]
MIFKIIKNKKILFSLGSFLVSLVVFFLKYLAWKTTLSVAFYSDMLETTINVLAAIFEIFAITISTQPADKNHTYGHYKAEYISAAAEGLLVIVTSILIFYEAWQGWKNPQFPMAPLKGIILNGTAGLVNLFWAITLIRVGKKYFSAVLIAGGQHVLSDVWTTIGLIVGFTLIPMFQWAALDALMGFFIAINILRIGFGIIKNSINGLMDKAPDPQTISSIYKIIQANAPEAKEFHMVRFRQVGNLIFIDFHLVVSGDMRVQEAHKICDRIEHALQKVIGNVSINIHVEPE